MKWLHRNDLRFEATFDRISPANFAEKVGIPLGWVVVHHGLIPGMLDRRKAHGEWFEITSDRGKAYRMLRFSPRLRKGASKTPAEIVIDWIGWIDLHGREEDVEGPIALKLRRVSWWKRPWAYLKHPDPAVRLSGWLGWASVILGIIALLLTLPYEWFAERIGAVYALISSLCHSK